MEKYKKAFDYMPTKNALKLECGTTIAYFDMESDTSILYILSAILGFCEDDKDFAEVNRFFKYMATTSDFAKEFYDKYSFIIGKNGKALVGDVFKTADYGILIREIYNDPIKSKKHK